MTKREAENIQKQRQRISELKDYKAIMKAMQAKTTKKDVLESLQAALASQAQQA